MSLTNKAGAPKKIIDFDQVRNLAKIQCTHEEIASVIGVGTETLNNSTNKKQFLEAFNEGINEGRKSLRRVQYEKAVVDGNTTMLVWLGKQYLKQRDKHEDEGSDLNITIKVDKQDQGA